MVRMVTGVTAVLLLAAHLQTPAAWGQNPYGGNRNTTRQNRPLPTFGVGSNQAPRTGTYPGASGSSGQSSQTYPSAPRLRRPVISPYMNLHRPEGIVSGVPNYYSLVRPRVEAFNRFQSGQDNLRRFQEEAARRQQENEERQRELYRQQEEDYRSIKERIDRQDQKRAERRANPRPTRYRPLPLRATGHATSFGR